MNVRAAWRACREAFEAMIYHCLWIALELMLKAALICAVGVYLYILWAANKKKTPHDRGHCRGA